MKVLVLGATGMLGNAMMRVLSEAESLEVVGTVRSGAAGRFFSEDIAARLVPGVDVVNEESLISVLRQTKPDVVINCIGLIKQLAQAEDPLEAISINSLLPHRLQRLCDLTGARLVHFSTDCIFSGAKGGYTEDAPADAADLYGKSKFLGEVGGPNAITLRTSIIGHELQGAHSLIEWFLSQEGQCKGYRQAIFSGLPTVVMAGIVRDLVIPNPELSGLYHVAAQPISKYALLRIVAEVYGKAIDVVADDTLVIDRSLNADRFARATGFHAPAWLALIEAMHASYCKK
jgi:dTDP-4-dehydrorhamnose reductase